jgi:hypothetical protein
VINSSARSRDVLFVDVKTGSILSQQKGGRLEIAPTETTEKCVAEDSDATKKSRLEIGTTKGKLKELNYDNT